MEATETPPPAALRPSVRIPLVILGASLLAAIVLSFIKGRPSPDGIRAMLYWSLPFIFTLSPLLKSAASRSGKMNPRKRATLLCVIGAVAGFIWSVVTFVLLGPQIVQFGFPLFYCWTFAGICGGIVANTAFS